MPRKKKSRAAKLADRRARYRIKSIAPELNEKQNKFIKAFWETRSKAKAAMIAGYKGEPRQAGYQAFKQIQKKAPDVIAAMGITLENTIENYLLPLCEANEIRAAQHEGKFTDYLILENHAIRLGALRHLHELMNAFPPEDQKLAAQIGVKVIVNDSIPRPDLSKYRNIAPQRPALPVVAKPNGAKPNGGAPPGRAPNDPRPKD